MKNSTVFAIILGTLVVGAFGQSNTSIRPRVAPTATPPTLGNDTTKSQPQAGPPVLIGDRNKSTAIPTATPPEGENEVIRVETNLVTLPVSVLDRDGRFISGLRQNEFKIFEDGVEQKVDYFQSVEQPFTVILLIDVSPSTQFKIDEIQNAAIAFIDQLRAGDKVMVIAFDRHVQVLSPITNNRAQLKEAVREAEFGDGTSLYEAVDYVIDEQLRRIQGRKAVVLFSDGVDTTSRKSSFESTLSATEEVDALFYTIRYDTSQDMFGGGGSVSFPPSNRRGGNVNMSMGDILAAILSGSTVNMGGGRGRRGGGSNGGEYERGRKYLETLAINSGGRQFEATSILNVDAAFSGIAEELRRQYSLGYYPESVGNLGDRKQIKIRVMRPGVMVRAKNSYIVGRTDRKLAGK